MSTHSSSILLLTNTDDSGKRLDQFLAENTDMSRTFCQKLIKNSSVEVQNKIITKPAYEISENEEISCIVPEPTTLEILPEKIPLDVLYEDEDVVVINKQAGMVVHPDETYSSGTLVNALLGYLGEKNLSGIGGVKRPGIVHRLDKDTSGVMIAAKNDIAHRFLSEEIAGRRVGKIYKTLVFGKVKHEEFTVDSPITRDPHDRQKMNVSSSSKAKNAVSKVHVEKFFDKPRSTFLTVQILTGRTHQIRVHMKSIGHPVVGDEMYGNQEWNDEFFRSFHLKRIFLHAESLEITLPNGRRQKFLAPLAKDLEIALGMLQR